MKFFHNVFTVSAIAVGSILTAPIAWADTVGAPFLTIEGPGLSGSMLDFFDGFGPSGIKEVDLAGTVTEAVGAPSTIGAAFSFSTMVGGSRITGSMTLGGTTLDSSHLYTGGGGGYDFDPFAPGPGDLNFKLVLLPPFVEPVFGTFDFVDAFDDWPTRTSPTPEIEVMLSVYLDGPLPTRIHEERDPVTGEVLSTTGYFEGALPIERITLGTIGGDPIAPVPLPAGFPLMVIGLAALRMVKQRA